MSSTAKIVINLSIDGLGKGTEVKDAFTDETAPDVALHVEQQVQETADEEEVLNVGAVDTIRGIWIRSIDNDIAIDTSFDSSFNSELLVREGHCAFFVPCGTVYIMNNTELEQVTFEYAVFGVQD